MRMLREGYFAPNVSERETEAKVSTGNPSAFGNCSVSWAGGPPNLAPGITCPPFHVCCTRATAPHGLNLCLPTPFSDHLNPAYFLRPSWRHPSMVPLPESQSVGSVSVPLLNGPQTVVLCFGALSPCLILSLAGNSLRAESERFIFESP